MPTAPISIQQIFWIWWHRHSCLSSDDLSFNFEAGTSLTAILPFTPLSIISVARWLPQKKTPPCISGGGFKIPKAGLPRYSPSLPVPERTNRQQGQPQHPQSTFWQQSLMRKSLHPLPDGCNTSPSR
jgi:hypothetical protein